MPAPAGTQANAPKIYFKRAAPGSVAHPEKDEPRRGHGRRSSQRAMLQMDCPCPGAIDFARTGAALRHAACLAKQDGHQACLPKLRLELFSASRKNIDFHGRPRHNNKFQVAIAAAHCVHSAAACRACAASESEGHLQLQLTRRTSRSATTGGPAAARRVSHGQRVKSPAQALLKDQGRSTASPNPILNPSQSTAIATCCGTMGLQL